MLARPERGCLALADITGYTAYLAGAELDHAQDVLADLMNVVVGALRPVLKLNKIEGDAAFVYATAGRLTGPLLLDAVESCFFHFQRRLRDIQHATTCECNACRLIPSLSLKLFAHDGEFVRQRIAGREELAGTDVIAVHRLMKNTVSETLGLRAYALLTEPCIRALGLDEVALGLREHVETYEHIGPVKTFVHDLQARWAEEQDRKRVLVADGRADAAMTRPLPAPPAVVWRYLTSPSQRPRFWPGTTAVSQENPSGRPGLGTTNHCAHGKDVIVEKVVDWRPFDYFTIDFDILGMPLRQTWEFSPDGDGTQVSARMKLRRAKDRPHLAELGGVFVQVHEALFARLAELIREDAAAESTETVPG
jgi:uncharacterized protein YndB with AHSA1/START domain